MTDRELLELAAKAMQNSGNPNFANFKTMEDGKSVCLDIGHRRGAITSYWRPMYDDGDALRLAVNLKLDVSFGNRYYFDEVPMTFCGTYWSSGESATFKRLVLHGDDPCAATRRAIVRAAAEVGKEMK